MMKLNFDSQFNPEPWTIVLCHRNLEKIGILHNISELKGSFNLNEPQEISFELHKKLNDIEEALWDEVYNLRVIWVKELNAYFQIELDIADTQVDNIKSITATSLCEAELSQIMLYGIEINTEEDITNFIKLHPDEDYEAAVFWNKEHPEKGLLYRVLEKAPHYTVKHVDDSLAGLQRNDISIDGTSIYDWLTGECAKMFDCIFQFDSTDRSISVYDLFSVCENLDCSYYLENHKKYRESFTDFCPKCGSRHITVFGRDTGIVVDTKNLTEEVNFSTDVDAIKNAFRLEAGDEYMTDAVRACNPNGSEYLYYFSDEMYHDMTPALVQKIHDYDDLYESYQPEYEQLMEDLYDSYDAEGYIKHSMSPTRTTADMNADTEILNLTTANLSPIVLSTTQNVTESTVTNAVKEYAKCYFRSGYFKIKALNTNYNSSTRVWTGQLKIINNSDPANAEDRDEGDVATTGMLTIQIYSGTDNPTMYETYTKQRMEKIIAQNTKKEKDNIIFQLLKPYITLANFKSYITQWSLTRLESFANAIEECKTAMIQMGIGADPDTTPNITEDQRQAYTKIWIPYCDKLVALRGGRYSDNTVTEGMINIRTNELAAQEAVTAQLEDRRDEIHDILNFQNYLGTTLYNEFCSFTRMDTYQNTNYISDLYLLDDGSGNYDNAGLFDNARKFIVEANKQIRISGEYQHSIETNLYNLLIMDEFKDLTEHFELGNFIRVRSDGNIYRLRLIHYEVDFDDLSTLNTEFSDMTKTGDSLNDVKSILDSARSMATSYGYTQKAALAGEYANSTLEDFRKEGLQSALYNITNNTNEEITLDNNGLLARHYDDITNGYSDEQFRITHNVMAFTKDNWKTIKMAMGHFGYYNENGDWCDGYGINANFVVSGFIQGSTIVAGKIYSTPQRIGNAVTHKTVFDLDQGTLNIGNGLNGTSSLVYDGSNLTINGGNFTAGSITGTDFNNGNGTFHVDANGNLTASSANISGYINANLGGIIGGFIIGSNYLYSTDNNVILQPSSAQIIVGDKNENTSRKVMLDNGQIFLTDTNGLITTRIGVNRYNDFKGTSIASSTAENTFISFGQWNGSTKSTTTSLIINYGTNPDGFTERFIFKNHIRLTTNKNIYFSPTTNQYSTICYIGPMDTVNGLKINTDSCFAVTTPGYNSYNNNYLMSVNCNANGKSAYFYGEVNIAGNLNVSTINGSSFSGGGNTITKVSDLTATPNYTTYGNIDIGQGNHYISATFKDVIYSGSGNIATAAYVGAVWDKTTITYPKDIKTLDSTSTVYSSGTHTYVFLLRMQSNSDGSKYIEQEKRSMNLSDERLKENIIDLPDFTNIYMDLQPKQFNYKYYNLPFTDNRTHFGIIAQDFKKICDKYGYNLNDKAIWERQNPEEGSNEDHYVGNDKVQIFVQNELHALHIQMIQKQHKQIEELKIQNQNLQSQINLIMNRIYQIENQR